MRDFWRIPAMMIWLVAIMAILLAGCATQSPIEAAKESGVATAPDQAQVNACLQYVKTKEDQELSRYDNLTGAEKGYALMHRETMGMIKNVWGKAGEECRPGTNIWDAYIVWAKEEGATKREMVREAGSTVRFASGVAGATVAVTELAKKAGDKIIGGDKTTAGQNANKAGEGIETSGSQSTVSTTVKQTQVAAADSSSTAQPSQSAIPAATPVSATPAAETLPAAVETPAATVPAS